MKAGLCAAVAVLSLLSSAAFAQDRPAYLWMTHLTARPGQDAELAAYLVEEGAASFDDVTDSRDVLEWGVAIPVVRDIRGAGYTHLVWAIFRGWAGVDALLQRPAGPLVPGNASSVAPTAAWQALVEPGSRHDIVTRAVHTGAGKPLRPAYIHLAYYRALEGRDGAVTARYEESVAPALDRLVANGTIMNHGLLVPEIRRNEAWTHLAWYASGSLADRDRVEQALRAPADGAAAPLGANLESAPDLLDPEGRVDQILKILIRKSHTAK
jgi:hypothetical protein